MLAITRCGIFFFQFAIQNLWLKIYRPVILPVVLFRSETWSLTWRKEHKLRMFENMMLRILGPEKDEVKGEWRKLHNEELEDLYSSLNIFRMIKSGITRWTVHVALGGWGEEKRRSVYRVLVGKDNT
jgi:hypothetical protein